MLRKTMEVLALFTPARRELGVVQAAELLGRPKSTVSRWLAAMHDAGFLDRDAESGLYRMSLRLAVFGDLARQTTSLQRLARPYLNDLADRTGETANLTTLVGLEAINVEVAESPRPVMHVGWIGRRMPLHATASGKSLLAHAPEQTVAPTIARGLERLTAATITDPAALRRELAEVRRRGYATAWAELEPDLAAVGAPVRDHRGDVVAAIAIGGPVSRCSRRQLELLALPVMEAARGLSGTLGYHAS